MSPLSSSFIARQCLWGMCEQDADRAIVDAGGQYCRMHALLVWSIIDNEMREAGMSTPNSRRQEELKAQKAAERKQAAEEKRTREGYVYYLRVGSDYKIGFASNLERRLASYPPDTELLAVEPGTLQLETERHREFKHSLISGREWYRPNPALDHHIRNVAENGRHTWWDDAEWRRRTERVKVVPHNWQ